MVTTLYKHKKHDLQEIIKDVSRPLNTATINAKNYAQIKHIKYIKLPMFELLKLAVKQCSRTQFTGFLARHKQVIWLAIITRNIGYYRYKTNQLTSCNKHANLLHCNSKLTA